MVLQSLARYRSKYDLASQVVYLLTMITEQRNEVTQDFKVSPILASSHANLAPATIHVAGVDTLTSEGIAYHEILRQAGTPSTLKVYQGVGHPFGHVSTETSSSSGESSVSL